MISRRKLLTLSICIPAAAAVTQVAPTFTRRLWPGFSLLGCRPRRLTLIEAHRLIEETQAETLRSTLIDVFSRSMSILNELPFVPVKTIDVDDDGNEIEGSEHGSLLRYELQTKLPALPEF